jgi:hypothetical protein
MLTKAIKVHYPNTRTDEDVADEVAKPYIEKVEAQASKLQEMYEKLEAKEKKAEELRQLSEMESSFGRLRSSYGYNDEGIEKIKGLMLERNIPDPEAAAALFERQNPRPSETRSAWEPDSWNLREDAVEVDVKGLFADPEKWADKMVGQVLADVRKQSA